MIRGEQDLSFTQEFQLLRPGPVAAYAITEDEWARIRNRLDSLTHGSDFFFALGWAMIGISASALFAAISLPMTLPASNRSAIVVSWATLAVTLVVGLMALLFSHLRGRDRATLKDLLVEDMDAVSARFKSQAADSTISAAA